ncbi:MAG TPA: FixH family protein [Chitinophagaceae bacterium]|nr:FixH family protein [Chitinophagaceae bacterium]
MKRFAHAGNVILFGFGAMVLFMTWLVFKCTQNPSMMVNDNYYEKELKYQDVIDARVNTDAYSDSLVMSTENKVLVFRIPASLNTTMEKASLDVYNKSDSKKDQQVGLEKNNDGVYTVNTQNWAAGSYTIKLSFSSQGKAFYKEFNCML